MIEMKVKCGLLFLTGVLVSVALAQDTNYEPSYDGSIFWKDVYVNFGDMNVQYPGSDIGETIQLGLTNTTGSGFQSKYPCLYGHLSLKLKLVGGDSAGTVTSYYMASIFEEWCELDFEFLGNTSGEPYILQTNVFSEGERKAMMDGDVSPGHVFVDDPVIRVFHNAKDLGIPSLDYQPMYIYSSIWNGESWATCGGGVKTNWTQQPFLASYTDFNVTDACRVDGADPSELHDCYTQLYSSWYGQEPHLALTQTQIDDLRWINNNYMIYYDYCSDLERFNWTAPAGCARNSP